MPLGSKLALSQGAVVYIVKTFKKNLEPSDIGL